MKSKIVKTCVTRFSAISLHILLGSSALCDLCVSVCVRDQVSYRRNYNFICFSVFSFKTSETKTECRALDVS